MARTVASLSPEAEAALEKIAQARRAYREAEVAYRAACVAAHEAGANFNAIGRAGDITPQAARKIVQRANVDS